MHGLEGVKQVDNATQGDVVGDGHHTEVTIAVLMSRQGAYQLVDDIVDIDQIHHYRRVVDGDGQAIGDVVAESGHGTVVVGPAPLAEDIGETVDEHLGTRGLGIVEE